ncbi:hypothetical protein GJ496_009136 [Pomphorhynchus laevis]|nr:hypothetical protein GJ496_009136 [Pomphorhynchus laevis]
MSTLPNTGHVAKLVTLYHYNRLEHSQIHCQSLIPFLLLNAAIFLFVPVPTAYQTFPVPMVCTLCWPNSMLIHILTIELLYPNRHMK